MSDEQRIFAVSVTDAQNACGPSTAILLWSGWPLSPGFMYAFFLCPRQSLYRIRSRSGAVVLRRAGISSTWSFDTVLARRVGTAAIPRGHKLLARPGWRIGFAGLASCLERSEMMASALSGLLYFLCHVRGLSLQLQAVRLEISRQDSLHLCIFFHAYCKHFLSRVA